MQAVCTVTLNLGQKISRHVLAVHSIFLNLNNSFLNDVVKNVAGGDIS